MEAGFTERSKAVEYISQIEQNLNSLQTAVDSNLSTMMSSLESQTAPSTFTKAGFEQGDLSLNCFSLEMKVAKIRMQMLQNLTAIGANLNREESTAKRTEFERRWCDLEEQ